MGSGRGDGGASPAATSNAVAGSSAGKRRAGSKLGQMAFMQRAAKKVAATAAQEQVFRRCNLHGHAGHHVRANAGICPSAACKPSQPSVVMPSTLDSSALTGTS